MDKGKKQLQIELWQECNNHCTFCVPEGSKVILKNNERIINNNNDILTVNSSSFTETADSNVKTADITMTVEKYRFQLAGNYCNTITFKASIS